MKSYPTPGQTLREALLGWALYGHDGRILTEPSPVLAEYQQQSAALRARRHHSQDKMTDKDWRQIEALEARLTENLVDLLRAGVLVMRGFLPDTFEIIEPPAEWFTNVSVDLDANTIEGPTGRLHGVMIWHPDAYLIEDDGEKTKAPLGQSPARTAATQRSYSDRQFRVWFAEYLKNNQNPSEKSATQAAKDWAIHNKVGQPSRAVIRNYLRPAGELQRPRGRKPQPKPNSPG